MKKSTVLLVTTFFLAQMASAYIASDRPTRLYSDSIPDQFLTSSETTTYEWGCPVSEVVEASSQADALLKIGKECMEEAKRAATIKPGVVDVIRVSVIVPDVRVSQAMGGFHLSGTFFLETLVLKARRGVINE